MELFLQVPGPHGPNINAVWWIGGLHEYGTETLHTETVQITPSRRTLASSPESESCLWRSDAVVWAAGGGHWLLVRMEWGPSGWSVCLPLLIFPCTIKFRSSLLAPADPGGPGKGP